MMHSDFLNYSELLKNQLQMKKKIVMVKNLYGKI